MMFLGAFLIAPFSSLLLIPRASCLSMFYSEDTRVSYTSTLPPIQSVLSFFVMKMCPNYGGDYCLI